MPRQLKKTGTMQITAQEGEGFLKRTWSDRTYNFVMPKSSTDAAASVPETTSPEPTPKKAKLAKHSTMFSTAKEAEGLLKDTKIDSDAKTRNQASEIEKIMTKKPKLAKNRTMVATAQESEVVLKEANIDEDAKTRNQSKTIQELTTPKKKLKKNSTMTSTAKRQLKKEAMDILSRKPLKGRSKTQTKKSDKPKPKAKPKAKKPAKKSPKKETKPKKPALKKAGTMVRTAKEGKAFVKRINKKSK